MIKRGLITPDTHFNKHDERAYELHMRFAEDFKPDVWVHLGDCCNFDGVSGWNAKKYKEQSENPVIDDLEAAYEFNRERRRICPKGRVIQLDGNHEGWLYKWLDKYPAWQGQVDVAKDTGLKEFKIEHVKTDSQPLEMGKINFLHGWYTNKFHANKHITESNCNIFYGHCHDFQSIQSKNIRSNHRWIAQSFGHLMDEEQAKYLGFKPTNWQLGFGTFYLYGDGYFEHKCVRIFKSGTRDKGRRLGYEGKVYKT